MDKNADTICFDDLELSYGQSFKVIIDPKDPKSYFYGIFIGCLPNEAIIMTLPDATSIPLLKEGQNLLVRSTTADGIAMFSSTVLFIADIPTLMIYLDLPQKIQYKSVRGEPRVTVSMPILASNSSRSLCGITGKITDISVSGARIDVDNTLGQQSDKITIKGKFEIAKLTKLITLEAIIRKDIGHNNSKHSYGIEFYEGDEETLLVLFGFIFSAISLGKIQKLK